MIYGTGDELIDALPTLSPDSRERLRERVDLQTIPAADVPGWRRVFGRARPVEVEAVDAVIAEEFERVDPTIASSTNYRPGMLDIPGDAAIRGDHQPEVRRRHR